MREKEETIINNECKYFFFIIINNECKFFPLSGIIFVTVLYTFPDNTKGNFVFDHHRVFLARTMSFQHLSM